MAKKKKKKQKDFILVHAAETIIDGSVIPDIPTNLGDMGQNILTFLDFINPLRGGLQWANLLTGKGVPKDMADRYMQRLKFKKADKSAGVQIDMDISAMERENGKIDFAFKANNTYQTTYKKSLGGHNPMRSLFQDMVRFSIWPKNSSSNLKINQKASLPKVKMKEVDYSYSAGWDTKAGFSGEAKIEDEKVGVGGSASVELSRSFSISAGTNAKDFDIVKNSDGATNTLEWVSCMQNMTQGGQNQPVPTGYDPHNPYSIVHKGTLETHLNDPAKAAGSTLELEYLAAYTSEDPELKNKVVEFEFSTMQRLIHAEVIGRFGLPGIEVGGAGLVVPYHIFTRGEIIFDLPKRQMAIKNMSCEGCNLKDVAGQ